MEDKVYAKYASTYRAFESHGIGAEDNEHYIVVNSCGIYDGRVPTNIIHRSSGRKDYYLAYIDEGRVFVGRGRGRLAAGSGDLLIFSPGEEQHYWYEKDTYARNYWVHFTGRGAAELMATLDIRPGVPVHVHNIPEIRELTEAIIAEINNHRPQFELFVQASFIQIISVISRRQREDHPPQISERNDRIYKSLGYIHENYSARLSMDELAKMAYLSVNRYSVVFKSLIGVSPQNYIIKYRLQKAMELLRLTDMTIAQVAAAVGYSDQLYFSRLFKRHMQRTPSDYIRQLYG